MTVTWPSLLQELRVAGLSVQVLLGFLPSLPFTNRYAKLRHGQRDLYLAVILLITGFVARGADHRLRRLGVRPVVACVLARPPPLS